MPTDKRPSEFGGVPGRIAPVPHEPTRAEMLRLAYATEPTDETDNEAAALIREWEQEGRQ